MGLGATKMTYGVRCEVVAGKQDALTVDATCDMEIRVHCARGALPVVLMYSMRQSKVYTHNIDHSDIGRVEFVECAVRRGAPSARGAIPSRPIPFCIRALDVIETRSPSVHVAVFERREPMDLGDALGLSVLLQPARRRVSQNIHSPRVHPPALGGGLQAIAEESPDIVINACEEV